ncbi:MAG: amidophosphoribosyltransferase, partial [Lysobacterales bacterium CG_4_9_14_3_um_filter_62_6]
TGRIDGLQIALIDDVVTTAATVTECARVLKQAGAAAVQVWALARAPLPR